MSDTLEEKLFHKEKTKSRRQRHVCLHVSHKLSS